MENARSRRRAPVALLVVGALALAACAPPADPEGGRDGGTGSTALRWERLEIDGAPEERWGFVVADRGDGTALLFGGTDRSDFGGTVLGDLWLVDARGDKPAFQPLDVAGGPSPRYCGCAAWDPSRRRALVVGGRTLQDLYAETWSLDVDGASWTEITATPAPDTVIGCSLVYVPEKDAFYLFGGGGFQGMLDETWRFDPMAARWTKLDATGPAARYDAALRYVKEGAPLVLFAGANLDDYRNDLWRFDVEAEAWSEVAVEGAAPAGRRVPWMVVEPGGAGLYAGLGAYGILPGEVRNDLWRFDLEAGTWSELELDVRPDARGFSLPLPGGEGALGLLLGGFDGEAPVADLWRLVPPG